MRVKKLALHRDTVHNLTGSDLRLAVGLSTPLQCFTGNVSACASSLWCKSLP
jgi:hypothetical protein